MRLIALIPKDEYINLETLMVVDDIIKGANGGMFLVKLAGNLIPLYMVIETHKFPSPAADGSRGATLTWALKGWSYQDMPAIEFYEQPAHYIDPII